MTGNSTPPQQPPSDLTHADLLREIQRQGTRSEAEFKVLRDALSAGGERMKGIEVAQKAISERVTRNADIAERGLEKLNDKFDRHAKDTSDKIDKLAEQQSTTKADLSGQINQRLGAENAAKWLLGGIGAVCLVVLAWLLGFLDFRH